MPRGYSRAAGGPRSGSLRVGDGLGLHVEAPDLLALKKALAGVDKTLVAELRRALKQAAEPVRRQVQANAAIFSRRIPRAVTIGTAFSAKRTGIFIRVNAKRAPHGRPLENDGNGGTFRHPVFGHDRWVTQAARPFFYRGAEEHFDDVEKTVIEVMDTVAKKAGFRGL
jgi:hypothetical protein